MLERKRKTTWLKKSIVVSVSAALEIIFGPVGRCPRRVKLMAEVQQFRQGWVERKGPKNRVAHGYKGYRKRTYLREWIGFGRSLDRLRYLMCIAGIPR